MQSTARFRGYLRLSRWLFPRRLAAKVMLLAFVAIHLPLIALLAYLLLMSDTGLAEAHQLLLVGLIATLAGGAITLTGVWLMLAPISSASQALIVYREHGVLPDLPLEIEDEGGRLLANVQRTLVQLDEAVARLDALAAHDGLTGLLNRREAERRLCADLHHAERNGSAVSVLSTDADRLKAVNDRWGHAAGDACIRHLADTIRDAQAGKGWAARWGGDEFVLMVPGEDAEASEVLERINASLEAAPVPLAAGRSITLRVSSGVARYREGDDVASIIDRADQALYLAKRKRLADSSESGSMR